MIAIYGAGYARTRAAAERLNSEERRRPVVPAPAESGPQEAMPEPPATVVTKPVETPRVAHDHSSSHSRASRHDHDGADAARHEEPSAPAIAVATTASNVPEATPKLDVPTTSSLPLTLTTETRSVEQLPALPPPPPSKPGLKDGTYYGWGTSRHGDIQARVVIADGRIASASIAQCLTRYSCSWISQLVPQVAQRQSAEVDYVSGATQSSSAFYYAVLEALSKAK